VSNATLKKHTQSGADFSECGRYRYKLWRTWDDIRPVVMFIMLNPSTADATANDPTIRRCIGFAHDWGYGGVRVGNLFAWRTPYPQALRSALDPIGRHNDGALCELAEGAALVVAAWGVHGMWLARARTVRQRFTRPLHALGVTKSGEPAHPLRLRRTCTPFLLDR
jgi:hypothetical protein